MLAGQPPTTKPISDRLLQAAVMLASIAFAVAFLRTALPRLAYPYDLDFIEDSMLMESLRVAQGQPVYLPPNADFNPHVYMPMFFLLGGVLFKLAGPSLSVLRLISFISTLVTTFLIHWISKRESGRLWVAIGCAGLFLGGYHINGLWYEVARVDPLFVALTLAGLALAFYAGRSDRNLMLSAVLLAGAAFTKQPGFVVAAAVTAYLFLAVGRRPALSFVVTFAVLTLIPLVGLNRATGGWFFYHIFHIGLADPVETSRLINFFTKELFGIMAGLTLASLLAAVAAARSSGLQILRDEPWLFGIALAIAISAFGRMRVGGNLNNRMPAYALLCLAPALLVRILSRNPQPGIQLNWLVCGLILLQLTLGRYSPRSYIPTAAARERGDHFVEQVSAMPGPVLVMMHPYYALMAGKEPASQIATLWYVRERGALPLPDDFVQRIESQYYAVIISDESFFETQTDLKTLLNNYYYPAEALSAGEVPGTYTGVIVRPKNIYLPREP